MNILLSRTDKLGDVVLTLPMAGWLQAQLPSAKVWLLGQPYTQPVAEACTYLQGFITLHDFLTLPRAALPKWDVVVHVFPNRGIAWRALQLGIPLRIGTSHRWYHLLSCNRLIPLGRKNSSLHEAQLNLTLLKPLGLKHMPALQQLGAGYGLVPRQGPPSEVVALRQKDKFALVLHPKSLGSAREWPLGHFEELTRRLGAERFQFFITGSAQEGALIHAELPNLLSQPGVVDVTGRLTLAELISLLAGVDGLVACSTGPLHLAAALGKHALGLYPAQRPMHPGRWAPVGPFAEVLTPPVANPLQLELITPQAAAVVVQRWAAPHLSL